MAVFQINSSPGYEEGDFTAAPMLNQKLLGDVDILTSVIVPLTQIISDWIHLPAQDMARAVSQCKPLSADVIFSLTQTLTNVH